MGSTGGMYTVELYARVRRAVPVEGRSQRAVASEFGLARKTVRRMREVLGAARLSAAAASAARDRELRVRSPSEY